MTGDPARPLGPRFEQAFLYAAHVHAGQTRKGTDTPYLSHLMAVASLVLEHGGDEDAAIAALLHDAVEDQGGRPRLEDIRRRFGDRVARIVEACSDADVTPKPPWRDRKEAYLEHLRETDDRDALLVSLADKLHNARAIVADLEAVGDELWDRFNAGREEALWYYRSLAGVFAERMPGPLANELARVVERMQNT